MPYLDDLNFVPINNHQIEINNHEDKTIEINNDTSENEIEDDTTVRRSSRVPQPSTRVGDYVTYTIQYAIENLVT